MDAVSDRINARFLLEWLKRNARKKGLGGLADFSVSYVSDYWFDFYYGTSTTGWIPSSQLNTTSVNRQHSERYQATKTRPFKKLMRRLSFPEGSVFIDVGCGKGKVLLIATGFGFARVAGVEFDGDLCRTARMNIEKFRRRTGTTTDVQVIESDILDYEIQPDENVFYLYNSFGEVVLRRFLENVRSSLRVAPRKVWLIYHIPIHTDVVEEMGIFSRRTDHFVGGTDFVVFEGDGPLQSANTVRSAVAAG